MIVVRGIFVLGAAFYLGGVLVHYLAQHARPLPHVNPTRLSTALLWPIRMNAVQGA